MKFDYTNMLSLIKRCWNNGYPVDITPKMAARWLSVSEGKNPRKVNRAWVMKISYDLTHGLHTTRTIRFHRDGYCVDGQHLLISIVETGVTAKNTFVEVGYEKGDVPNMDIGGGRTFNTTAVLAESTATNSDAALAIVLEYGFTPQTNELSFAQRRMLVDKHRECVSFTNNGLKSAKRKPVAMKKAIADVYKAVKDDPKKLARLERFVHVFSKLDIEGGSADQAAVNLSKLVSRIPTADRSTRKDVYDSTISAIDSFMKANPAKKICKTKKQKSVLAKM